MRRQFFVCVNNINVLIVYIIFHHLCYNNYWLLSFICHKKYNYHYIVYFIYYLYYMIHKNQVK